MREVWCGCNHTRNRRWATYGYHATPPPPPTSQQNYFSRAEITYIQVNLPIYLKLRDVVNNIFGVPLYKW